MHLPIYIWLVLCGQCRKFTLFQLVPKVEILTITKHGPDGESMNRRRVSCLFRTLFGHPFVKKSGNSFSERKVSRHIFPEGVNFC